MQDRFDQAAARLYDAATDATPCDGLADLIDIASPDDGYQVQERLVARRMEAGQSVIGHKIGLTSAAVQAAFGAKEPMRGVLFADTRLKDDDHLDLSTLCTPKLEGEILLTVGAVPDPDMDDRALAETIAGVQAAVEIADSRISDWRIAIGEAIADNGCCARLGWTSAMIAYDHDVLARATMTIHAAGEGLPLSEGAGVNCLGHPLNAYRWLVEAMAQSGTAPQPSEIILTGALGPPVAMRPAMRYSMSISGFGAFTLRS